MGREQGIAAKLLADIELAVYEALVNAAMHAYPRDAAGSMSLHAQILTGQDGTGRIVIEAQDGAAGPTARTGPTASARSVDVGYR